MEYNTIRQSLLDEIITGMIFYEGYYVGGIRVNINDLIEIDEWNQCNNDEKLIFIKGFVELNDMEDSGLNQYCYGLWQMRNN